MFKEVPSKVDFVKMEEEILKFWQENQIFKKSLELRADAPRFVFYEGPPTANGRPHAGHALGRIYKDTIPRYQTMKGKYVLRKGGWDCHGLPVEIEVEKELGFSDKQAIEDYGVAEFNAKCRESVFRYVKEWRRLTDRIAFWIDMDDPYITLTNKYIESVWWILKQLWDRDLIYQGYKVVPYCPRCGTPLSSHEVALGYKQTEDPSLYIKFPLRDEEGVYFLVWTTTPWTLPGNVALAIHPDVEYALVEQEGERLILAKDLLLDALEGEYRVVKTLRAKDLVGKHYKPLYTFLPVEKDYCYVIAADFVTTKEGTGVVHMAPAFGADDLEVGKEYDLPVLHTVDLRGAFIDQVTPWRGLFVKDADPLIIEDLRGRGLVYRVETYVHTYPFCWRCDTPLLYYAKTSWFIETTRMKDNLIANNKKINWYPEHIRDGRFGDWLENNVDWALGRDRYWGTPLPIWVCDNCGKQECIGSVMELKARVKGKLEAGSWKLVSSNQQLATSNQLDLHRPYIDQYTWRCEECGGVMRRVPEVIDAWFDSGAMPIAQWHYPFEGKELFEDQFPADFICEAVDQTRGWFYSLHAISTLLFDEPCYKNVICYGHVLDAQGVKMSKSKGNVVDPWDIINVHGADALRWYFYTASPPDYARRFSTELVGEAARKFMLTLWNTYSFFVTYANIDQFDPTEHRVPVERRSPLDRWILAELNTLIKYVDERMSDYDMTAPARRIQDFVEDLSNWYVRLSRRRFWKGEKDEDKAAAYLTLYECLTTLSKLLAPFTPFLAEEMYRNLVCSVDKEARESVHLCDFPIADEALIDEKLMADTQLVRKVVGLGRAARSKAGIKLRQPLSQVSVKVRSAEERESLERLSDQVLEELNVKELRFTADEGELVSYTVGPVPSLLGPKYGRLLPQIQAALGELDASEVARRWRAGEAIEVAVEGQTLSLEPEELSITMTPKEGYAVAAEGEYLVGVATALTDELIQEGLARELVRRIQTMRKSADFRIEDHIVTYYQAGPALQAVLSAYGDYIKAETLSEGLIAGSPPAEAYSEVAEIEGEEITLGIVQIR